jgi:hypothetical protein
MNKRAEKINYKKANYDSMLAFDNKNTSTAAKSFNAKIKKRSAIIQRNQKVKLFLLTKLFTYPSFAIDPILINN